MSQATISQRGTNGKHNLAQITNGCATNRSCSTASLPLSAFSDSPSFSVLVALSCLSTSRYTLSGLDFVKTTSANIATNIGSPLSYLNLLPTIDEATYRLRGTRSRRLRLLLWSRSRRTPFSNHSRDRRTVTRSYTPSMHRSTVHHTIDNHQQRQQLT